MYQVLLLRFIKSVFFLTQNVHATIDIIIAGILEFFLCIYATILDPLLKRHVNLLASIVFVHRLVRFECYMKLPGPLMRSLTSLC